MTPEAPREPRDERGPDDDRDERDPRLLGDPRDQRDPRSSGDARDPADRWSRYATRGQLAATTAVSATVTTIILIVGFFLWGASQDELCDAIRGNQEQMRRVVDPALRSTDPVKARTEIDARTRSIYRETLPNISDAAIERLLEVAADQRREALGEIPLIDCSGPSI